MNAGELWDTAMNPDTRSLDSVTDQVAINGSAVQIRVYADGEARYDESL